MNKIGLFLSCAFLLLFLASSAEAETFASVPLYISGEPEGTLSVDSPSGSNVESVVIASNEQDQQGVFREIGRWSTGSLDVISNLSGEMSGNVWVSSNRDATVNIRYTISQDDNNLAAFEFSDVVPAGETVEITGSSNIDLTNIDQSPLTLIVEGSWTAQAGSPPPGDEDGDGFPDNTSIVMEYGASSKNTGVELSISHVQIRNGGEPFVNEGQSEVTVYIKVYSAFGVDDILSNNKGNYELLMGPKDESIWESSVESVSQNSNHMEVQFLWSYVGKSLPAGDNDYDLSIKVTDSLNNADWINNKILNIYITPKPDVEMDSVSSTSKKVVLGNSAIYTLSIRNTGSGEDDFIVTTEYVDDWDISIDFTDFNLDAGESKTIKVTVSPKDSVSDGQELSTTVTVTADSDSSVKDSKLLTTTAEEAEPDWDFSIEVIETDNDNFDDNSFVIKDRASFELKVLITNRGNT
ncbi:MAG: CARDB domain-containing protein, partial [Candidatus Poseidoniales archaeon]